MTTVECLVKAKELISTPDKWTKKAHARDINGKEIGYERDDCYSLCAEGALIKASNSEEILMETQLVLLKTGTKLFDPVEICPEIPIINDNYCTTHDQVMEWFNLAIQEAAYH